MIHTKEPWTLKITVIGGIEHYEITRGKVFLGSFYARANAERALACVNALAGRNAAAVGELVRLAEKVNSLGWSLEDDGYYEIVNVAVSALAKLKESTP